LYLSRYNIPLDYVEDKLNDINTEGDLNAALDEANRRYNEELRSYFSTLNSQAPYSEAQLKLNFNKMRRFIMVDPKD